MNRPLRNLILCVILLAFYSGGCIIGVQCNTRRGVNIVVYSREKHDEVVEQVEDEMVKQFNQSIAITGERMRKHEGKLEKYKVTIISSIVGKTIGPKVQSKLQAVGQRFCVADPTKKLAYVGYGDSVRSLNCEKLRAVDAGMGNASDPSLGESLSGTKHKVYVVVHSKEVTDDPKEIANKIQEEMTKLFGQALAVKGFRMRKNKEEEGKLVKERIFTISSFVSEVTEQKMKELNKVATMLCDLVPAKPTVWLGQDDQLQTMGCRILKEEENMQKELEKQKAEMNVELMLELEVQKSSQKKFLKQQEKENAAQAKKEKEKEKEEEEEKKTDTADKKKEDESESSSSSTKEEEEDKEKEEKKETKKKKKAKKDDDDESESSSTTEKEEKKAKKDEKEEEDSEEEKEEDKSDEKEEDEEEEEGGKKSKKSKKKKGKKGKDKKKGKKGKGEEEEEKDD